MSNITEAFVDSVHKPSDALRAWCSKNKIKITQPKQNVFRFNAVAGKLLSDMMWKFHDDFPTVRPITEANSAKASRDMILKLGKQKKALPFNKKVREELTLVDELLGLLEAKKKKKKEKQDDELAFGLEVKDNFDKAKKAIDEAGLNYTSSIEEGIHLFYFDDLADLKEAVSIVDTVIDTESESEWSYIKESVELAEEHDKALCKKVFAALNSASEDYPELKKMTASEAATDLCDYNKDFEGMYRQVLPHVTEWVDEQKKAIKEHAKNYGGGSFVFDKAGKKKAGPFKSEHEADTYIDKLKKKNPKEAEGCYVDNMREDVEINEDDIDVDAELALMERKWLKNAVNPAKKGMFDGKDLEDLEKELAKIKKSGPHKRGTPEYTKMHELLFAIRAKKNHGFSKK